MKKMGIVLNGLWKENPILVTMLGLCSLLAVTTKLENAIGMGVAVIAVLILSNVIISLIKNIVPDEIRIPVYIVVVATLVTAVDMIMAAYTPSVHSALGIFIPLIVVNCIILGRAEAYASKNTVLDSFLDAVGNGLGYTLVLMVFATIKEVLGTGQITIWGDLVIKIADPQKATIFSSFFVSNPASFILLGIIFGITAMINKSRASKIKKEVTA